MVNGSIIRGLSVCLVLAHAGWQSSAAHAQANAPNSPAQASEQENAELTPLLPIEERLSSEDIEAFLENPVAWLAANPNGGAELAAAVVAMAGSDPRTIEALVALTSNPNVAPLQKAAIGAGLARVAAAASANNPTLSSYIIGQMQSAGPSEATTSFEIVLGAQSDALSADLGGGIDTLASPRNDGSFGQGGFSAGGVLGGNTGGGGGGGTGSGTGGGSATSGTAGSTATVATEGGSSTVGSPGTIGNGNSNTDNDASPTS